MIYTFNRLVQSNLGESNLDQKLSTQFSCVVQGKFTGNPEAYKFRTCQLIEIEKQIIENH